MARAGLEPLRVRDLHVPEPFPSLSERGGHVRLFDVHVERIARHKHRRAVDRVAESRRVQDGHADVVLIAIERLDEDARAGALGTLRERPEAVQEERLVLGTRPTGRDARKIPRASPDRDDHDAGTELARKTEELRDVGARGRDVLGIRIDEPAAVAARDRGHRDPLADRGPSFIERWALRELESIETKAPRRLKFLRERRSRHEPVLDPDAGHDGARAIVVFISAISTQARRLALTMTASAKRTWRRPSSNVGSGTGDGVPSSVA